MKIARNILRILKQRSVIIFFSVMLPCLTFAIENERYQNIKIEFSQSSLTVKQALDELSKLPEVSVVYNGNESFLELKLSLPTRSITVQDALDIIWEQAPVDIVFNNNHIIVKGRKLQESYQLKGTVKDVGTSEALMAATVIIPGTTRGTVTDINGIFSMQLAPGIYEIGIRYMGYKDKQFTVNLFEDKNLFVFLEETQEAIQEVNVIGTMGEIENLETGRPIEQIESKTINQLNTNVVNDALHGRINGVWTTKVSGAPGDHNKIRIRGISSIFGSTDPLYVVDGMIIPIVNFKTLGIADLNTHDVENITILKDASSTALYGYLGGNGVILIETKKGGGETQFNFNVKKGIQWFPNRYSLMNSEDFLTTLDSSDSKIRTGFYDINPLWDQWEKYPYYEDSLGNTIGSEDFQEELFQRGDITEFQLSGQGNLKGMDYYLSGNYYTHEGIITNTQYDKYSFTANISKIFKEKGSVRLLYKGSWQENKNNLDNYLGNSVIYKGINFEPGYRFTPDSFYYNMNRFYYNDEYGQYGHTMTQLADHHFSPDKLFYEQSKTKTENSNSFNFQGIYRIADGLSFHAGVSLAFRNILYKSYLPERPPDIDEMYLSSDENYIIFNQQYDLRYEKLINNHSLSAFLRYRNYKDNVYWEVDSIKNVDIDGLKPEDNIYLRGSQAIFGEKGSVLRTINSTIFNINYSYSKKYLFSFITNFDHLKEGYYVDQKEIFYSVALDYDLSKERFLSMPSWVNAFHLYANYGQAGNYPLNSLSNDLYSSSFEYTANDTVSDAVFVSNLANHYLKHEKVSEYNFGTEIALFGNRLVLSGDYYIKALTNLLIQRTIPYYYVGGIFYQNIGEMENKGIELSLELTPIDRPDFYWSTKFGFASNNQVITKLYDGEPISFNDADVLFPDFYARENEVLGAITGYSYQGEWNDSIHGGNPSDDIRYVEHKQLAYLKLDTLRRRTLTEEDKTIIGNSIPDFTFNWINLIRYKNFTCEMLWYAVIGVDKYNATKACTYVTGTNSNVKTLVMDTMNYHTDNIVYESSYFVEDASFIRLKTLSFRYAQPRKIAGRVGIIYTVSFENLVTLTRYTGYDPEATIYTNNNFTDNALDKGSYPNPMGVYFSINLSF